MIKIHFSDFFEVSPEDIKTYGAYNISLINDLPLFIDPFLLYGSDKDEYQELHKSMLKYIAFLKEKSEEGAISESAISAWYKFPEVKQNWFGYSLVGNSGHGLGLKFGMSMSKSIVKVFRDIGLEKIVRTSHIEKVCLFSTGVGRDNISDFTTNLIKEYLLSYTEEFAKRYINPIFLRKFKVEKVYFDYKLERWMPKEFILPCYNSDYVVLTPRDILTKDETWINSRELYEDFDSICNSISNEQLRFEITNYFIRCLPKHLDCRKNSKNERRLAIQQTIEKYSEITDWYIRGKESDKDKAIRNAADNVLSCERLYNEKVQCLANILKETTRFYNIPSCCTYVETLQRVEFLKWVIENKDAYRIFYLDDMPIKKEQIIQLLFKFVWFGTSCDVNREVNNGRGPVDYTVSKGARDKTIVEFKLASNPHLMDNLANQVRIYKEANKTDKAVVVILYFDEYELKKTTNILNELNLTNSSNIVLIDARKKESASVVKIKKKQ